MQTFNKNTELTYPNISHYQPIIKRLEQLENVGNQSFTYRHRHRQRLDSIMCTNAEYQSILNRLDNLEKIYYYKHSRSIFNPRNLEINDDKSKYHFRIAPGNDGRPIHPLFLPL